MLQQPIHYRPNNCMKLRSARDTPNSACALCLCAGSLCDVFDRHAELASRRCGMITSSERTNVGAATKPR